MRDEVVMFHQFDIARFWIGSVGYLKLSAHNVYYVKYCMNMKMAASR